MAGSIRRFFNLKFLQSIDLELLRRFLDRHAASLALDTSLWDADESETRTTLIKRFTSDEPFPEDMSRDLHAIATLGNQNGLHALMDCAELHGVLLMPDDEIEQDKLRNQDPKHMALRAYLDNRAIFDEAATTATCRMPRTSIEYKGIRNGVAATCDDTTRAAFVEKAIVFFKKRLKGKCCNVVSQNDHGTLHLVVTHGKGASTIPIDKNGQQSVLDLRCLGYSSLSYTATSGVLSVMSPVEKERAYLRDLFAETMLGDKDFFKDADQRPVYVLDQITQLGAAFELERDDVPFLHDAWMQEIMIRPKAKNAGDKNTRKGKLLYGNSMNAVRDLMLAAPALRLEDHDIAHIRMILRFKENDKDVDVPVVVSPPNKVTISPTGRVRFERAIMQFLELNGFYADGQPAALASEAA